MKTFVPLEQIDRPFVSTEVAAHYLNRRPQTLRVWSCRGTGPIRPVRVYGRLAWPLSEIRRLLGVPEPGVVTPTAQRARRG